MTQLFTNNICIQIFWNNSTQIEMWPAFKIKRHYKSWVHTHNTLPRLVVLYLVLEIFLYLCYIFFMYCCWSGYDTWLLWCLLVSSYLSWTQIIDILTQHNHSVSGVELRWRVNILNSTHSSLCPCLEFEGKCLCCCLCLLESIKYRVSQRYLIQCFYRHRTDSLVHPVCCH